MENYMDFLNGEVRYNSLQRQNPEKAARLFAKNESEAQVDMSICRNLSLFTEQIRKKTNY